MNQIEKYIQEGRNVFLTGPGGCGKTTILKNLKKKYPYMILTALTGVAAINLGGCTFHRWASIQLGNKSVEYYTTIILRNKTLKERWRKCRILVIDEISMMGRELLEKMNELAQLICNDFRPFGGIQLILAGDMLQLPPVNDDFPFQSNVWKALHLETVMLYHPYRFNDLKYFYTLLRIREGIVTDKDHQQLMSRVQAYEDLDLDSLEIKPTRLYSKKMDVNSYNLKQLGKLPDPSITFDCFDTIQYKENSDCKADLNKLKLVFGKIMNDSVAQQIELKKGAQVMLTYNLDTEHGLVNGSRGVVTDITNKDTVWVKFLNQSKPLPIVYNVWSLEDENVIFFRSQIPLILAWACTIHKSQSATLDLVIADLGSIFLEGQSYVALSRVRNWNSLYLLDYKRNKIKANQDAVEFMKSEREKDSIKL